MEAICSSETSVLAKKTLLHHIPETAFFTVGTVKTSNLNVINRLGSVAEK
jgi:hypothetical protein